MVIPLILGGIARGAALAGRGARWGLGPIKNHPASQWVANNPMTQSIVNHPLTQKVVQHPATKIVGGTAGLMGGLALAAARRSHRAAQKLGENEIGQKAALILIFPVILTIIDYFYGTNGIPLDSIFTGRLEIIELLGRIGTSAPYWAAVIIYWIMKKPQSKEEWIFPLALFMLGFFTLTFGVGSRWVFLHSVFAVITFAYLLDGFNADIKGVHWAFLIMVFMDIFGLATINNLFPETVLNLDTKNQFLSGNISTDIFFNRLLVPYWFFFYLFQIRPGRIKTAIAIGLTLFYTGYGLTSMVTPGSLPDTVGLDAQKEAAKKAGGKVIDTWRDTIASWLTGKIQYAVTGKVEENEFEPLGVYLENVQSADPRYYEDEDVIVWGTLKARTLDDPINIKVGCFVERDKKKTYASKTDPDKKFSVFALEEQDFACTFSKTLIGDKKPLRAGSNTIKAFADFNFETLAYLKTYFIDRERQRAMVREGLDPFKEFAIEDKSPIAVYTNGPAKIEMGTNNPLVSVSMGYIVEPSLDIKISNREGWQGRINQLEELVLFLPDGIDFNKDLSCNKKFVEYKLTNCELSCAKFVEFECKKVCEGFTNPTNPENTEEKDRCDNACTERTRACEGACGSFFTEGDQLYNGYALDVTDIKYKDESKDFEKGKLFRCRFQPTANVLGASPFTTKSFRVKARYDYTVEKPVSVGIDKLPEDKSGAPGPSTPTSFIKINNDAATTTSPIVTLLLSCSFESACIKMKISNKEAEVNSVPERDYAPSISWTLESGDGTKAVYVKYESKDRLWSNVYADNIELTTKPVVAPKLKLGEICGNDPLHCTNLENNAKCESGNCGFISNENRCGCITT